MARGYGNGMADDAITIAKAADAQHGALLATLSESQKQALPKDLIDAMRRLDAAETEMRGWAAEMRRKLDKLAEPGRLADVARSAGRSEFDTKVEEITALLKAEVMDNIRAVQKDIERVLAEGKTRLDIGDFTRAKTGEKREGVYRRSIVAYWDPLVDENGQLGAFRPKRLVYPAAVSAYCKLHGEEGLFGDRTKSEVEAEALEELAALILGEIAMKAVATRRPADPLPRPALNPK